jgi:hypothetical protein
MTIETVAILPTFDAAMFGGLTFPYKERNLESSFRAPIHEFPGLHGGTVEKLGRRIWTVRFQAIFDTEVGRLRGYDDQNGMRLYPDVLDQFESFYAQGLSFPLRVPPRPFFRATITEFSRRLSANSLSGEDASITFTEDVIPFAEEDPTLGPSVIEPRLAFLRLETERLKAELVAAEPEAIGFRLGARPTANDINLLEKVIGLADDLMGLFDKAELAQAFLAAKAEAVAQTMGRLESRIRLVQNPEAWPITNAIHNLRSSVFSMAEALRVTQQIREHVVATTSDLPGVSLQIFGTTQRGADLLDLNDIPDPFVIPAGTKLRYFLPLERQASL